MSLETVVAAYIIHQDKVLLIDHKKLNRWLPVGGHIEKNETPDDAIRRETREEVDKEIKFAHYPPPRKRNNREYALPFYTNVHPINSEHFHYCLFYLCLADSPEVGGEYKNRHRWFSAGELNTPRISEEIRLGCLQALELAKKL